MTGPPPPRPPLAAARSGPLALALIGRGTGWHARRIAAVASARGHGVVVVGWDSLSAGIDGRGDSFGPPAVAGADLVCVRGMPGGPPGSDRLEQVVFRLDVLGRLALGGTPVVNSPRALEAAIDKYLSLARIAAAGIPVPRTAVVQRQDAALAAFESLGGDCVVKPLFGSQGKGLLRVRTAEAMAAWMNAEPRAGRQPVCYLQEFLGRAGWDARILLVGERVFAMRRAAPPGDWRTNLALGGEARPFVPPSDWVEAARLAAAAVGADPAGVDVIPGPDGGPVVLEVNAVPGWRGLEAHLKTDVTAAVVDHLERAAGHRA